MSQERSDWYLVGRVSDIAPQAARVVDLPGVRVAVFRTLDNRIFAIEDRCPHRGGPLSEGLVHGHKVTCPLHDWTIDLNAGRAVLPDEGCVLRFPVEVREDEIYLLNIWKELACAHE